jgi:hypothetical protein
MANFNAGRSAAKAVLTLPRALAQRPFCWALAASALACSVYEDPHSGSEPVAVGGTAGVGSSSSGGDDASGGSAGSASSTAGSGGSAGSSGNGGNAGTGAEPGTAGDSGSGTGSVSGSGGSSAGSSGNSTSGAGGSGGSAGVGGTGPVGSVTVIDDMEDNDAQVTMEGGRDGFWYVGNDGTVGGAQEPPASAFAMNELTAGDRQGSSYSAHMKVSGFAGWGSVIGFNFVELLGAVKPYDASSYCGVRFWGKAAAATSLRVRLPDGDTHPAGGVCVDPGAAGTSCYDHFGKSVTLTAAWTQFDVRFSEVDQAGTGYHPADKKLKPSQLYALEWALPGANKAYEIWIDDVSFVPCP